MSSEPGGNPVWLFPHADRPHDQSLVPELPVKRLDLRGQLPRADRSPGGPEVEKHDVSAEGFERVAQAIERGEFHARGITPPGADREGAKKRIEIGRRWRV